MKYMKRKIKKQPVVPVEENQSQGASFSTVFEPMYKRLVDGYNNDKELIYHYTNIEALLNGIAPAKPDEDLCFWATNVEYMNDPQEMSINLDELKKDIDSTNAENMMEAHYEDITEKKENLFVISFSENSDNLPMWGMYGKNGNGIALEFERSELPDDKYPIVKCIYQGSDTYKRITKFVTRLLDDNYSFVKARFYLTVDKQVHPESPFNERKERIRSVKTGGCQCDIEQCLAGWFAMTIVSALPIISS